MSAAPITRAPSRLASWIAVGIALVALGALATAALSALYLAFSGVVVLLVGVVRGWRAVVNAGAVVLFAGTIAAGTGGAPVETLLVATTATILAWDVSQHAISIGDQLGLGTDTRRIELVHAATDAAVGAAAAGFGYGLYRGAAGDWPLSALAFLVVAAVLVASALR